MSDSQLERRLGLGDAWVIGVSSMVGAGVFAVFGPAAAAAGSALLLGLLLAALVAWCNATSSAQLAAQYPSAGGTYVFGRERLGPWWGYLAGWSFVVGKTASAAAMAMVLAAYLVPAPWQKPTAIAAVWLLVAVNVGGITRTARVARVLVVLALAGLAVAVAVGWAGLPADHTVFSLPEGPGGWYGVLQSAGLMFFAFAGYARLATLGEEVREPERIIPRAIVGALLFVLAVYAVVAVTLLLLVGADALAGSRAPVALLVEGHPWARWVLGVAAAAASGGALLALLTGIGRTGLAMARTGDLPRPLAVTHPTTHVPHRIELLVGALLTVVLLLADLRGAVGFSSFGVLLYYFVANVAAFTQEEPHRRYAKAWQVLGAVLCVVLVATLPWVSVLVGLAVLAVGVVLRLVRRSVSGPAQSESDGT